MLSILRAHWFVITLLLVILIVVMVSVIRQGPGDDHMVMSVKDSTWEAPSLFLDNEIQGEERAMVIYGEELIMHTSKYLGPRGTISQISNGMNCQNCHLDAGTRSWGNNYGAVYATYPKFRERSGAYESIYKRVNDCFERSLNGTALDSTSKEMKSMYAYMKWLGKDVAKGTRPHGVGLEKLAYLNRAADPAKGKMVYVEKCQTCHGINGEGQPGIDGSVYAFPPLWGKNSYNDGAGLFRLSSFASFVKNNMPFNQASHNNPALTLEQAWDVAAFVNSQERPHKDQSADWPDVSKKPVDFPFGPYADSFSTAQHKFGPYAPIEKWKRDMPGNFKKN